MAESSARILFVANGFPNAREPDKCIFNFRAVAGISQFHEVTVVTGNAWRPGRRFVSTYTYRGIRVICFSAPVIPFAHPRIPGSDGQWVIRLATRSIRLFARGLSDMVSKADLVHSVMAGPSAFAIGQLARSRKVATVVQVIGADVDEILPRSCGSRLVREWAGDVGAILANSRYLAGGYRRMFGVGRPVAVIYRGTDLEAFSPIGDAKGPQAGGYGTRFLYVGGFPNSNPHRAGYNNKGGETLLSAWKVADNREGATRRSLVIAGPMLDLDRLAAWRAGLRHPEAVFIGGRISPEDMPGYLRATDCLIVPSLQEGLPNSAVEAAACGRAVIGSDVGGIPEVVVSGESGWLFPARDSEKLSDILVAASSDPGKTKGYGENGRKLAERNCDSRDYGRKVNSLYLSVLSGAQGVDLERAG